MEFLIREGIFVIISSQIGIFLSKQILKIKSTNKMGF